MVENALHKDSALCSYCSAFISTFFLCESGKSDTEVQFSKNSPLENTSLFPTQVFSFAAAGLDTLLIRSLHNCTALLVSYRAFRGPALPSAKKGGQKARPEGEELLSSCVLWLLWWWHCKTRQEQEHSAPSPGMKTEVGPDPVCRVAKGRPAAENQASQNLHPKRRWRVPGGSQGTHCYYLSPYDLTGLRFWGESREKVMGCSHRQPFCLLLCHLLFPLKIKLT